MEEENKYNAKEEVEKICDEHKITFSDKLELENLELIKAHPLINKELLDFIEKKEYQGHYILKIIDPDTKAKYPLKIYYEGGKTPESDEEKSEKEIKEEKEILEKFKDPNLMKNIIKELDKDHLGDDNLKKTGFYVAVSSNLENSKLRQSMALTGESGSGKDNLIKTLFKHMPQSMFLTGATQPAIEDLAIFTPLLGLSEMNLFRDFGANKGLLEVVKQRTEGGTSAIKKDAVDNFKTTKHERTEQGTVFYGTTDAERNDEMETRFIFGHSSADEEKVARVNMNTAINFSDPEKIIEKSKEEDSWIKKGLRILRKKNRRVSVLIPFATLLTGKNKAGNPIIDTSNPRSMRDLKRIYALICARTWLFSEQRVGCQFEGVNFITCMPEDMLEVIKDTQECFNQTYSGMDERLNNVLKIINDSMDWTARDMIQKTLGKSRNTIKAWCKTLADEGLIEGIMGAELNKDGSSTYDYNKVYYRGCQKGVKKVLIRCQYNELKELIEEYQKNNSKGIDEESKVVGTNMGEIDTLRLTPSENNKDFNEVYINNPDLSEEDKKKAMEILNEDQLK